MLSDQTSSRRDPMRIARVSTRAELPAALLSIGLTPGHPVLVVVGGAGKMTEAEQDRLRPLFSQGLAPLVQHRGALAVDGGTDAGVMRLMGEARANIGATFPLVGVAPAAKVQIPDDPSSTGSTPLEPRHSHVVLVPASTWAEGTPWIAQVATELAAAAPSVTVLIDGGDVSWLDVEESIALRRPVIVIAGTGRTADQLAAAVAGDTSDARAQRLIASGLISAIDLAAGTTAVVEAVGRFLPLAD